MGKRPWWVLTVLPAIHILLIVLTIWLSARTPGATYYRIIGVDPQLGILLWISEGVMIPLSCLLVGTTCWLMVGMGWSIKQVTANTAARGVVINTLVGLFAVDLAVPVFRRDLANGLVSLGVGVQYVCIGFLCLGAFVSATYSWKVGREQGRARQLTTRP